MFSMIRRHLRLSPAGVIAVIALVFAMIGGAFAASNSGTGSATVSKGGKRGPTGPRGPKGPKGPAGPQGVAGANGKDGSNGVTGPTGKDGVSPVGTEFAGAKGTCTEGGVELKGTNTTFACNGKKGAQGIQGEPGPLLETLPSGKAVTGAWGVFSPSGPAFLTATLSYQFKLAAPLAKANIIFLKPGEGETATCPGTAEAPKAAAGNLCIYAKEFPLGKFNTAIFPASMVTGVVVGFEETFLGFGTWALTAP